MCTGFYITVAGWRSFKLRRQGIILGVQLELGGQRGRVQRTRERVVRALVDLVGVVLATDDQDERAARQVIALEVADALEHFGAAEVAVEHHHLRGVTARGLRPGLEHAVHVDHLDIAVGLIRELLLEAGIETDGQDAELDQTLQLFGLGHLVFPQESQEALVRDPAVLAPGDAVPLEPARVEPLADGSGGHLADLGDLARGEDGFHNDTDS